MRLQIYLALFDVVPFNKILTVIFKILWYIDTDKVAETVKVMVASTVLLSFVFMVFSKLIL